MYDYLTKTAAVAALLTFTAPASLLAGSYGESAVRDATVGNTAANAATVACPRLGQNIPANLAAQMDCGSGEAKPAVAGERVRNGGFLGGHQIGSAPPANSDSSDFDPSVASNEGGNGGPGGGGNGGGGSSNEGDGGGSSGGDGGGSSGGDGDGSGGGDNSGDGGGSGDNGDSGSTYVTKWERLSDFGVTPETYGEQSEEFWEEVRTYRREKGKGNDWSNFQPTNVKTNDSNESSGESAQTEAESSGETSDTTDETTAPN